MKIFRNRPDTRNWVFASVVFVLGLVSGKVFSIIAGADTSDGAPLFGPYCWGLSALAIVLGAIAPALPPRKPAYLPRRQWLPTAFILFLAQLFFTGRTREYNPMEMSLPIVFLICLVCAFIGTALRAAVDAIARLFMKKQRASNQALHATSEPAPGAASSSHEG